jgi:hypothetical protein
MSPPRTRLRYVAYPHAGAGTSRGATSQYRSSCTPRKPYLHTTRYTLPDDGSRSSGLGPGRMAFRSDVTGGAFISECIEPWPWPQICHEFMIREPVKLLIAILQHKGCVCNESNASSMSWATMQLCRSRRTWCQPCHDSRAACQKWT